MEFLLLFMTALFGTGFWFCLKGALETQGSERKVMAFFALALGLALLFFLCKAIAYPLTKGRAISQKKKQLKNIKAQGFVPEKTFSRPKDFASWDSFKYDYLAFDFTHGLFAYEGQICPLRDVAQAELINDSTVVQSASAYQDGWAVVGGAVPGVGAVTGRTQMHSGEKSAVIAVRVMTDNPRMPSVMIPFLFGVADKASEQYQDAATAAYDVYGIFESVIRRNKRGMGK